VARAYVHAAANAHAEQTRLRVVLRFEDRFGDLGTSNALPVSARMADPAIVRAFVAFAVVFEAIAVDAIYVMQSSSKWGFHLAAREPVAASAFHTQATGLGFCEREASKMWSKLAQICVIAGTTTDALTSEEYAAAQAQFHSAVVAKVGRAPKSLNAPLFGLDALMFIAAKDHDRIPATLGSTIGARD